MQVNDVTVKVEVPEAGEYCALRRECALTPRTEEAAQLGLPRSLFAVCLRDAQGALVGMGRVVGDLGCHVTVADICVAPAYQKRGLATVILNRITQFIAAQVPLCAFVSLFADVDYLYQKHGFQYPVSKGMFLNRAAAQWQELRTQPFAPGQSLGVGRLTAEAAV